VGLGHLRRGFGEVKMRLAGGALGNPLRGFGYA